MKKLNNKGFTLIEIVIVIVIIAILAAMLVPSLTSWIDNSKQKSFIEGANSVKTACLSQLSTNYATYDDFAFRSSDKDKVKDLAGDGVILNSITGNAVPSGVNLGSKASNPSSLAAKTFDVVINVSGNTFQDIEVIGKDFTAKFSGSTNAWEVAKNG